MQVSANISSRSHSHSHSHSHSTQQPSRGGDVQPVAASAGAGGTAGGGRAAVAAWAPQIVHVSSTPATAGMTWSGGQWRPGAGAGAGGGAGEGQGMVAGREYSGAPSAHPATGQRGSKVGRRGPRGRCAGGRCTRGGLWGPSFGGRGRGRAGAGCGAGRVGAGELE